MISELKPYPAYKNSGVSWLGEVPDHWEVRRLKDTFERIVGGSTPSSSEVAYWDGDVVWITPADISKAERLRTSIRRITREGLKSCSSELVPPGSIVVTSRAPVGNVALADVELCTNQGCKALVISDDVMHPLFGFAVMFILKNELQSLATGTTFTEVSTTKLGAVPIPLPPLPEQSAIVRFLNHADRKIRRYIRAKQKLIKLLEEQKQAIIHRAVTRGLDPNVRLKPSGIEWLGEVPEHWEVLTLGKASFSIQTGPFGSQLHANEYVEDGIPVINPSHMHGGLIHGDLRVTVSDKKAAYLKRHTLKAGDIVLARRGELGRCALVMENQKGWLCGTGSLRIRARTDIFEPSYLVQLLSSSGVRDTLSLSSIGATMDNLNASMVARLRLLAPAVDEQSQIMNWITQESNLVKEASFKAEREISLLREYRTRLIADVVTGKLDVREAAASLPDEAAEPELPEEVDEVIEGEEIVEDTDLETEDATV